MFFVQSAIFNLFFMLYNVKKNIQWPQLVGIVHTTLPKRQKLRRDYGHKNRHHNHKNVFAKNNQIHTNLTQ